MNNEKTAQPEPKEENATQTSQITRAAFKFDDLKLSIEDMLKVGVHFGHKKARWNPKMQPYIFTHRNDISIIDLEKTLALLEKALEFVRMTVRNGGKILFVGTKPQAKNLIRELASAVDMPYVTHRWLGGTFTNFSEIKKRLKYLNDQEAKLERGEFEKYTKYEKLQFMKEISRMNEKMGGIKKMDSMPQAILVADAKENYLTVKEAREARIPVIAIVDTNIDPDVADYPIPGNDDALSSLRYLLGMVAKVIKETKAEPKPQTDGSNGDQAAKRPLVGRK